MPGRVGPRRRGRLRARHGARPDRARRASSSPAAACRSRRSAPASGATCSPAGSATGSSSRGRRWSLSICDGPAWEPFAALAGVSLPVRIAAGRGARRAEFVDDLLFTHRGLSGPAALQASTYWRPGEAIDIDLAPGVDLAGLLTEAKTTRRRLGSVLADLLPRRLAEAWLATLPGGDRPVADSRDRDLAALAAALHRWTPSPTGTEGYRKAEVTAGGVDTRDLDSRSCESRLVPGLHFIGEVVDVTGWLGGYNFQWAWASAAACARAMAANCSTGRGGL